MEFAFFSWPIWNIARYQAAPDRVISVAAMRAWSYGRHDEQDIPRWFRPCYAAQSSISFGFIAADREVDRIPAGSNLLLKIFFNPSIKISKVGSNDVGRLLDRVCSSICVLPLRPNY
jgi:hypothetical protein